MSVTESNNCQGSIPAAAPIIGDVSFHSLMTYIGAASMAVCCANSLVLIIGHLINYRNPRLQRQIVRIVITPPFFAICCFIGLEAYEATEYIVPIAELYEVFAMVALLFFMCNLLTPHATSWAEQGAYFADSSAGGPFKKFARHYFSILQIIPVRTIVTIAEIVLHARECRGSDTSTRGQLVITIVNAFPQSSP